jgi:hypothetical protein
VKACPTQSGESFAILPTAIKFGFPVNYLNTRDEDDR